ncbi:MAG: hypothetical protein ACYCXW_23380 [Solirubrobacteraceae bacterium]
MTPGPGIPHELVIQFLVALVVVLLGLCAAVGLLMLGVGVVRRGASKRRAGRRGAMSFYVGRLEDRRAIVYIVDRDLVRRLFETTPAPACWAQIAGDLARRLATDAAGGAAPARRGVGRVARRLEQAPADGFVIERRTVAVLTDPSPARRWACRVRTAARPSARLRRVVNRRLGSRGSGVA